MELQMDETPASLLERLRAGNDRSAWDRFYQVYGPLVRRWARGFGLTENDAADLQQEVFVLLVRKLPTFAYDPSRSFRAWLRQTTLNKIRELARRRPPVTQAESHVLNGAAAVQASSDVEDRREVLLRTLALLRPEFDPTHWNAFWNYAVLGKPVKEVAAELAITPDAVYLAKHRILARLRRELNGLWD
jgi:RNA polymerase sigma-70 factor (ECF subfamily)